MPRRQAFSLLEILLVLALLVVAAALTAPILGSMFKSARVRAAADAVRAALLQARTHAMEETRSYRVGILPGGVAFRVAPNEEAFWTGSGQGDTSEGAAPAFVFADNLTGGVRFAGGDATPTTPGSVPPPDPLAASIEPSRFEMLAIFDPDGTAEQDVEITFRLPGAQPLLLTLRGMTGVASVKPVDPNQATSQGATP